MTKMMTPLDILEEADRVLASPDNWIKGDLIQNRKGESVASDSEDAACFCLSGALVMAQFNLVKKGSIPSLSVANEARSVLLAVIHNIDLSSVISLAPIPKFNDRPATTFEDVKAVIKAAIEIEKAS